MHTGENTGAGAHVEAELPLFHLGALSAAEGRVVVAHLDECSDCRAAQAEVCQVLGTLALLTEDREDVVDAFGAPGTARPAASPSADSAESHKPRTREAVSAKPASGVSAPGKSAPAREVTRPGGARRRRRSLIAASCMLVSVLTVGGLAVTALLHDGPGAADRPATTVALTAVASATDRDTGAQASVFLTEQSDGVALRATLDGLTEGHDYRLYAQAYSGQLWPIVNWTGADGVQEVHGVVPSTLAALSRVLVERGDHKPVVIVYLPRRPGEEVAPPGR